MNKRVSFEPPFVEATVTRPGEYADKTDRLEIRILRGYFETLPYVKEDYPIDIQLVIGHNVYSGRLNFAPSDPTAWLSAPLNGGCKRLVDELALGGFRRGRVKLKVEGKRVSVLEQLTCDS